MTLVAMLLISSSQGSFEECSEESSSQEIELVLNRRDQRNLAENDSFAQVTQPIFQHAASPKRSQGDGLLVAGQRSKLNGCGSYLRI